MMKATVNPDLNSKFLSTSKSYTLIREKKIVLVDIRFYQKLFALFIALSTFLIIPESPRELENICEKNNPKQLCDVW